MAENNEVLDWRGAIRKRPAMYTGSTGFNGFTSQLKLIIQSLFFQTNCNQVEIDITDKMSGRLVFYNLEYSVKDSTSEDLHLDCFEFAVINALCSKYEFNLFDENNKPLLKQVYQKGLLKKGEVRQEEIFSNKLEIVFNLDSSIWDFEKINFYILNDEIRELAFLCSGKKFEFKYLEHGEQSRLIYNFETGLLDKLEIENGKGWGSANFLKSSKKEFTDFSMELAFGLSSYFHCKKFLGSFVNFAETKDHGTHVIGLLKGLKKGLKAYQKKHLPDNKVFIKSSSIKNHLLAAIHIQIEKPTYWGPTRGRLQNLEIIKLISNHVAKIFLKNWKKTRNLQRNLSIVLCMFNDHFVKS